MKASRIVLAVMIFMLGSVSARAAALTWKVPAGNWSVPANWTNNVAPTGGADTVTFTNILPGVVSTNDITALSITSVTIKDGTNTLDLAGNSLTCKTFAVNGFGVGSNAWVIITNGGTLIVTNTLSIGVGTATVDARLALSPDTALQVGLSASSRALLQIGELSGNTPVTNTSILACGKVFNAYLSDLFVGRANGYNPNKWYGLLDLSAATNQGVLDIANNVTIGARPKASGEVIVADSIDVKIGTALARGGILTIGITGDSNTSTSSLTLGKGRFDAYVTSMKLGVSASGSGGPGFLIATNVSGGILDISQEMVLGQVLGGYGYADLGDRLAVRVGAPGARAYGIILGSIKGSRAIVMMGTGSFEAYVTNFWVGKNDSYATTYASFDASRVSTGILTVSDSFIVGLSVNGGSSTVKLGDRFVTTVGSADQRATMLVGGYRAGAITITMTAAGTFNAYLSSLMVGSNGYANTTTDGLLDLSAVTNGIVDVSGDVRIGSGVGTTAIGELRLPAIPVSAGTLIVGTTNTGAKGTLTMTGTVFAITNSVAVDGPSVANKGRINVTVAGTSAGLDLDAAATLSVTQGVIAITFKDPAKPTPLYWGLRWKGDHAAALATLKTASKLTWDATAMTDPKLRDSVAIFVQDNVTYVGARKSGGTLILVR